MKKSLVLAMAMALGVTASAYAANPFSDVPAGHWAYDSISKLAAAGIIEGYGDDTFRGDRLMTRYEMAQIVAKALAKGANVDKLAAEFADELDALGVRVAALEKKSDNVKITGQFRYHYEHTKFSGHGEKEKTHDSALRSRIWFTGTVNDNWNYVGMLQNWQDLTNNTGDETTDFQRAYLDGRIGGVQVRAGRHDFQLGDANLYDTRMDGIKISYGSKVKLGAYYGKPTNHAYPMFEENGNLSDETMKFGKFWGVNVGYDAGKLALNAAFDQFRDVDYYDGDGNIIADPGTVDNDKLNVWNIGATYNFGKATLGAIFLRSNMKGDHPAYNKSASKNGIVVTATYGGAESAKVGSWGLTGKYYNQGVGTFVAHTMNGHANDFVDEGFKGYSLQGDVTVAKNMIASVQYYDLKGKMSDVKARTLWSELTVTF
ncbi:MAG: S-layer homology domain-containing protein [Acidaminococcaceae bacterium]|nr:S-layer homology domain-containing protein [Acidaminococcaceae bacterium]